MAAGSGAAHGSRGGRGLVTRRLAKHWARRPRRRQIRLVKGPPIFWEWPSAAATACKSAMMKAKRSARVVGRRRESMNGTKYKHRRVGKGVLVRVPAGACREALRRLTSTPADQPLDAG